MVARMQSQAHPRHEPTAAVQYHYCNFVSVYVYSSHMFTCQLNLCYSRIESGVIYSVYIIISLALLNIPGSTVHNAALVQVVVSLP